MAGSESLYIKDENRLYTDIYNDLLKQADEYILEANFSINTKYKENKFLHNIILIDMFESTDCYVNKALHKRNCMLDSNKLHPSYSYNVEVIKQICPSTNSEWTQTEW